MPEQRTLHLPEPYAAQVRALLQQHIPEAEVWAYGSRVRGDHYAASDLDLVVRFLPSRSLQPRPDHLRRLPGQVPAGYALSPGQAQRPATPTARVPAMELAP